MDARCEELTLQLLRAGSVRNNFFMADTEYKLMDATPDWGVLSLFRSIPRPEEADLDERMREFMNPRPGQEKPRFWHELADFLVACAWATRLHVFGCPDDYWLREAMRLGDRLHVFGCPDDYWLSEAMWARLDAEMAGHGVQATWVDDVSHTYCTSSQHCDVLTQIITRCLAEDAAAGAELQAVVVPVPVATVASKP
ncbi:hypothetical protein FOA52_014324 [Chlamydomonas sp. UWO 241]|nr:hypothetical protein FOA52_014324 [Chlamydomonas sp. UWO 241]